MEPVDGGGVEGLSAAVIEREAARSRERLGVDVIDVYWAHGEDRSTDRGDRGGVRRAGRPRRGRPARGLQPPDLAGRAGPAARGGPGRGAVDGAPADDVVRRAAAGRAGARQGPPVRLRDRRDRRLPRRAPRARAVGLQPAGPGQLRPRRTGRFPEAYDHPGTTARLAALARGGASRTASRARRWCWPGCWRRGWKPIVGVSTLEQLDSALAAASLELSPEELAALDAPR